ncbi:MAG: UDP-N-acetylmuramate dehydrogenase [Bacteroidetes bacterium]|nr:MAG: UDP-N-acetylmuramate dehydrogenase [Bacteroidota bacterium]
MKQPVLSSSQIRSLQNFFGSKLKKGEMLNRYSVMNVGGPADYLVTAESLQDLDTFVCFLWEERIPFLLLGGGSNTLISDAGIRELVLINEAKEIKFLDGDSEHPLLWAESGASFGSLARRAGSKGWSGLEWASGIPGTVGGAVVNNAGAFGSNVAEKLEMADILHPSGDNIKRLEWSADQFAYSYRSSVIKSGEKQGVVLSATFRMEISTPAAVKAKISDIAVKRQSSQPAGASLGSMFKNPPGDFAGRLIEEAGLKGTRVGDVEISSLHGNFFLNKGTATASDITEMIALVRDQVHEKFGVDLELEIQFIGDWK